MFGSCILYRDYYQRRKKYQRNQEIDLGSSSHYLLIFSFTASLTNKCSNLTALRSTVFNQCLGDYVYGSFALYSLLVSSFHCHLSQAVIVLWFSSSLDCNHLCTIFSVKIQNQSLKYRSIYSHCISGF